MRQFNRFCASVAATVFAVTVAARGAVIVTPGSQHSSATNFTPYAVSTTDLIENTAPIASTGDFTVASSTGLPALTDGNFTYTGNTAGFATGGAGTGTSVTYSLGSNPLGYDMTGIDVYVG